MSDRISLSKKLELLRKQRSNLVGAASQQIQILDAEIKALEQKLRIK